MAEPREKNRADRPLVGAKEAAWYVRRVWSRPYPGHRFSHPFSFRLDHAADAPRSPDGTRHGHARRHSRKNGRYGWLAWRKPLRHEHFRGPVRGRFAEPHSTE